MQEIRIRAGGRSYPVLVGEGTLVEVGKLVRERLEREEAVVVADRTVNELHGQDLRWGFRKGKVKIRGWIDVPPGERSKSLSRARSIYDALVEAKVDRWTPVVALGGGVTGDLAGFAASTFMRGVPVVHVPSTVVAQVDSAIGGKTAVNFAGAKNLVGTFYQPEFVVCDPALLQTLSLRDFRAGLAEAVKIGITMRPDLMKRMESDTDLIGARDVGILIEIVVACVEAKGEIVARDEADQDVRSILNYGHTIGHAIEAASRGKLRHGEAVAVGMNAAAWIGETLGVTQNGVRDRQNALLENLGLKLIVSNADKKAIVRNLKLDKKLQAGKNRFVLTLQVGSASVWPHISGRILRDAVRLVTS
jgi:3-dehydroquinate synthase